MPQCRTLSHTIYFKGRVTECYIAASRLGARPISSRFSRDQTSFTEILKRRLRFVLEMPPKKKGKGYIPMADRSKRLAPRIETYAHKVQRQKKARDAARERRGLQPRGPHRWRPGTKALFEIRHYQKETGLLLPRAPMWR